MARVNIDILRINEQKWLEWVNLILMTIISTTVGENPLEEMMGKDVLNKGQK